MSPHDFCRTPLSMWFGRWERGLFAARPCARHLSLWRLHRLFSPYWQRSSNLHHPVNAGPSENTCRRRSPALSAPDRTRSHPLVRWLLHDARGEHVAARAHAVRGIDGGRAGQRGRAVARPHRTRQWPTSHSVGAGTQKRLLPPAGIPTRPPPAERLLSRERRTPVARRDTRFDGSMTG